MLISLRAVTVDNFDLISELPLLPQQRDYLASNDYSMAQASFIPPPCIRAPCMTTRK